MTWSRQLDLRIRTKKEDTKQETCSLCECKAQSLKDLANHLLTTHGDEEYQRWRLGLVRDRRMRFDNLIGVTAVVGPTGSGKSLFVVSQMLQYLANGDVDLVVSNMSFNLQLLSQPDEWKQLTRQYIEQHYPPKWKEEKRIDFMHEKILTIKRESLIEQNNKNIDCFASRVSPSQFVHIDTETTSSDELKRIIESKAKEFGLVDENGSLLIRVLLVWDEAYAILESRRSGSTTVIDLSEFALQARHYGTKIWVVTPLFNALDVRYRQMCEQAVVMRGRRAGKFHLDRYMMYGGQIRGEANPYTMPETVVIPLFFFYNTWERPILTITEIENKEKQSKEESRTAELQEYVCEICNRTVVGATNFKAHKASHTADSAGSAHGENDRDVVVDQIKSYLASHPDAGPTEMARALNIPRTTVRDALERLQRANRRDG